MVDSDTVIICDKLPLGMTKPIHFKKIDKNTLKLFTFACKVLLLDNIILINWKNMYKCTIKYFSQVQWNKYQKF